MSFTPSHLYFDDVEIGQEWRSLGRTITEADVVNFAGLSGDIMEGVTITLVEGRGKSAAAAEGKEESEASP
jgi:hypothetical protein